MIVSRDQIHSRNVGCVSESGIPKGDISSVNYEVSVERGEPCAWPRPRPRQEGNESWGEPDKKVGVTNRTRKGARGGDSSGGHGNEQMTDQGGPSPWEEAEAPGGASGHPCGHQ